MKCRSLASRGRFMPCRHLVVFLGLSLLLITKGSFGQIFTTTPRFPGAVKHSTLGTWTNFNADALKDDDNNYMEYKFAPSWNGSDRLICYNYDFTEIPNDAIINRLFFKIIRFKKNKPEVTDALIFFSKNAGDQVWGPNLAKTEFWPTTEGAAYYEMDGSSAGVVNNYSAYSFTAADIKQPGFSIRISAYRNTTSPATIYFEQVAVWVEYTVPSAVTTSIQAANDRDLLELKQYNRNVHVKGLKQGSYQLTITDLSGRIIQQNSLRNSGELLVALNGQCKGYCIITIEGNGKRKTIKTFVQ